jgi:hypothetical protein
MLGRGSSSWREEEEEWGGARAGGEEGKIVVAHLYHATTRVGTGWSHEPVQMPHICIGPGGWEMALTGACERHLYQSLPLTSTNVVICTETKKNGTNQKMSLGYVRFSGSALVLLYLNYV